MNYFNELIPILAQDNITVDELFEFFNRFAGVLQKIVNKIIEESPYSKANMQGEKGSQTSSAGVKGNALTPVPGSTTAPISNSQEATQASVINAGENAVQNESYIGETTTGRQPNTTDVKNNSTDAGVSHEIPQTVSTKLQEQSISARNFEKFPGGREGQNNSVSNRLMIAER